MGQGSPVQPSIHIKGKELETAHQQVSNGLKQEESAMCDAAKDSEARRKTSYQNEEVTSIESQVDKIFTRTNVWVNVNPI